MSNFTFQCLISSNKFKGRRFWFILEHTRLRNSIYKYTSIITGHYHYKFIHFPPMPSDLPPHSETAISAPPQSLHFHLQSPFLQSHSFPSHQTQNHRRNPWSPHWNSPLTAGRRCSGIGDRGLGSLYKNLGSCCLDL